MSLLNERVYDTVEGASGSPLDRVRALFHGSISALVNEGSIFQAGIKDNCYWFTTGFDHSALNQVAIYNSDPLALEAALTKFYDANLLHCVYLGGAGLAHAETLRAKGYVNKGARPLMAYALDPKTDQHKLRLSLEVKRIDSQEDLADAQLLLAESFDLSPDLVRPYTDSTLGIADSYRYLLFDGGVPVTTSHFIKTGKFLGCFDVATPKQYQRKGYGEELMRWVFATHAALGDELIILQSSIAGETLYRRTGYQFLEYVQSWQMEDTTRMRRFTHHELNFGEFNLRPLTESDSEWIIPYLNDEAIAKWMGMPAPYEEQDFVDLLQRWRNAQSNGVGINWVIEDGQVPVGMIACHHTDWKFKRTEIGYMAFPPSRGRGVIPTVTKQLVEFVFKEYEMERIEIRTDVNNEASRRAAQKAGFTHEGLLRRNYLNRGEVSDDAIFSMIKEDLAG